ncbi:hypothetical protein [Desulfatibacillum aliphaticivorans]|uniref:hypothetical protein n=1 Tax=Desulfatibacillum aliphaticivorans TaxID=218208 RepID=UPI0001600E0A|nr:hypothetical protein [Desulfatibacillum aliphaticivorans]
MAAIADVTTVIDICNGPIPDIGMAGQILKNAVKTKAKKKTKKGFFQGLISKIKDIFGKGVNLTDAQAKRMKKIQEINHNFTVKKTLSGVSEINAISARKSSKIRMLSPITH